MAPNMQVPEVAPARDGADEVSASPDQDTALARIGKAMHRLLEWGDASAPNVVAVAREFDLDTDQGAQAAAMALCILHGAGAWAWDDAAVGWQANEVELMYQGETYRLDRLVQRRDSGHWWVLDFKSTGMPLRNPALVAQMQTYLSAVQNIYPGETVRAAFLTGSGELIELPQNTG